MSPRESQPEHISAIAVAYQHIYQIDKQCPKCGKRWIGNTFVPASDRAPAPRMTTCGICLETEEAAFRERQRMTQQPAKDIELAPMREPGE